MAEYQAERRSTCCFNKIIENKERIRELCNYSALFWLKSLLFILDSLHFYFLRGQVELVNIRDDSRALDVHEHE